MKLALFKNHELLAYSEINSKITHSVTILKVNQNTDEIERCIHI